MSIYSFFTGNMADAERRSRTMFLFKRDGREVRRSYGEAFLRVQTISLFASRRLGLASRGAPVAIMLENGATWIELYLGHNALAVPVVPLDPKLKPQEISYILNDSKVTAIYTDAHHVPVLFEIAGELPCGPISAGSSALTLTR